MASITEASHMRGIPGWRHASAFSPGVAASAVTISVPIFVAPFNCEVGEVALINSTGVFTGANTNTVHANLIDGGAESAGTTEINNIDFVLATDLAVGKTLLHDAIAGSDTELFLTLGDILELQIEEVGTGSSAAFPDLLVITVYRPANLAS